MDAPAAGAAGASFFWCRASPFGGAAGGRRRMPPRKGRANDGSGAGPRGPEAGPGGSIGCPWAAGEGLDVGRVREHRGAMDEGVKRPVLAGRSEWAWPQSLLAGFLGTWVGLQLPYPGLAVVLALLGFLPVFIRHVGPKDGRFGLLLAFGWLGGGFGAYLGAILEGGMGEFAERVPLGSLYLGLGVEDWASESPGGAPPWAPLARLAAWSAPLLLARRGRGLLFLPCVATTLGALALGTARLALERVETGGDALTSCLLGVPPFGFLQLLGTVAMGMALADPGPIWPLSGMERWRRWALCGGPLALLLGAFADATLASTWAGMLGVELGD